MVTLSVSVCLEYPPPLSLSRLWESLSLSLGYGNVPLLWAERISFPICLPLSLFVSVPVCLSLGQENPPHPPISPSIPLSGPNESLSPSVCLSWPRQSPPSLTGPANLSSSPYLSVCLCLSVSVFVSVSLSLSLSVSVCLSLSLSRSLAHSQVNETLKRLTPQFVFKQHHQPGSGSVAASMTERSRPPFHWWLYLVPSRPPNVHSGKPRTSDLPPSKDGVGWGGLRLGSVSHSYISVCIRYQHPCSH